MKKKHNNQSNLTNKNSQSRRDWIKQWGRFLSFGLIGLGTGYVSRRPKTKTVWQVDPSLCVQCGRCAVECVLSPSAVKCMHAYQMCGYCKLCGGYHRPNAIKLNTAAENQLCPTGAIQRKFIEDPFYEYTINEPLCIGCGKCVRGCGSFGNGSLYLQINHSICVSCNDCSIAKNCPSKAINRVPLAFPYLQKGHS